MLGRRWVCKTLLPIVVDLVMEQFEGTKYGQLARWGLKALRVSMLASYF